MVVNSLAEAREYIGQMRSKHQKESKWFEIYKDDKLIYDSAYLHRNFL